MDELTLATRQDHSHLHSAAIRSKRALYQFESQQVNARIVALMAAVCDSKQRRNELNAMILGLGLVLERR